MMNMKTAFRIEIGRELSVSRVKIRRIEYWKCFRRIIMGDKLLTEKCPPRLVGPIRSDL
jgi:hypothetical protein